jgi:hypothetical protein
MPLEVRRDEARDRARQAVARVRELDPGWKPRTMSLAESGSMEGAIRHNDALRQEAEARFVQLSRAGRDTNWPRRDPADFGSLLAPGGELVGNRAPAARENVRTVSSAEFESIRSELMIGARQLRDNPRYDGVRYQREDGSSFGLRLSHEHGLTLDVLESNTPLVKNGLRIHQR